MIGKFIPSSERDAYSFRDEADFHRETARYELQRGRRGEAKEWLRMARAAEANARAREKNWC